MKIEQKNNHDTCNGGGYAPLPQERWLGGWKADNTRL